MGKQRGKAASYRTKRHRLLIYPKFQLTMIGINIAVMLAGLSFIAVQFIRSIERLRELGVQARLSLDHAYFRFLDWQTNQVFSYFITAFIVAVFVSALTTLILSHQLAGPVDRLKTYFTEISEKGFPQNPIRFRKRDFFSDLPGVINKAFDRIKDDKGRSKKDAA